MESLWKGIEQADEKTAEKIDRESGKLPNNAIEQSGKGSYWVLYRYAKDAYGYADASLNKILIKIMLH